MIEMHCDETRTVWFENTGDGKFLLHAFPVEAQFAPVNAIEVVDADNDGNLDVILAGNEYQIEIMTGRYDASYGLLLKGNGGGEFRTMHPGIPD